MSLTSWRQRKTQLHRLVRNRNGKAWVTGRAKDEL